MSVTGVVLLVAAITAGLAGLLWLLVWLAKQSQQTLDPRTKSKPATFESLLWPRFSGPSDAEVSSRRAGRLSLLTSALNPFHIALRTARTDALADSLVFALVGAGLFRCSRVAAFFGLVVCMAELVWAIGNGAIPNPSYLLFLVAVVTGTRTSFAYRRLAEPAPRL